MFTPGASGNFLSFSSRVAQKREDAVSKEVTRKLSEADNRKMSRKEKDERFDSLFNVFLVIRKGVISRKCVFGFCLENVDIRVV